MATRSESAFSRRLRELLREGRKAKGLTQRQLAERLAARGWDVDVTGISKIESGTRNVTIAELDMIGSILETSVYELFKAAEESRDPARVLEEYWEAVGRAWFSRNVLRSAYRALTEAPLEGAPSEVSAEVSAIVAELRPEAAWAAIEHADMLGTLRDGMRARLGLPAIPYGSWDLADGQPGSAS